MTPLVSQRFKWKQAVSQLCVGPHVISWCGLKRFTRLIQWFVYVGRPDTLKKRKKRNRPIQLFLHPFGAPIDPGHEHIHMLASLRGHVKSVAPVERDDLLENINRKISFWSEFFGFLRQVSFSESGSLGNSSGSDVTSLSSQLPDTPNSMVPSPVDTWRGLEVSWRPRARTRVLCRGRAETSVTFNQGKTKIRTRMDYARWYIQVPTGGLEVWLFPLHLDILAHRLAQGYLGRTSTHCWWTLWASSYGTFYHDANAWTVITWWICNGIQRREPVLDVWKLQYVYQEPRIQTVDVHDL